VAQQISEDPEQIRINFGERSIRDHLKSGYKKSREKNPPPIRPPRDWGEISEYSEDN
jgi:hypothetical protein